MRDNVPSFQKSEQEPKAILRTFLIELTQTISSEIEYFYITIFLYFLSFSFPISIYFVIYNYIIS